MFGVMHKGDRIGSVQVRFSATGAGTGFAVSTFWNLAVKVVFVTVYAYRQEAYDRWQDDRLVQSDIMTDDNGKISRVRLREAAGVLRVDGPAGAYTGRPPQGGPG
jgi:hypothetical protein